MLFRMQPFSDSNFIHNDLNISFSMASVDKVTAKIKKNFNIINKNNKKRNIIEMK